MRAVFFSPLWRLVRIASLGLGIAVLLSACETLPQPVKVDFVEPKPVLAIPSVAPPAPTTGSLFNTVSFRPGFEDRRPRLIGDVVTIQIIENVTASQKSTSTTNRTSSTSADITAVPGLAFAPASQSRAAIGASSESDFSGKGGTESANTFSGTIMATVVEVQPNGHLVVVGEKQIGVNQNVDVLRFSGTIDPRLILPGSIINSNQVANVRVESKGRGAMNEAQTVGWFTRFFYSFWPF